MNEKNYLKERAEKNYIKGLLFEIVSEDTDLDQLVDNIYELKGTVPVVKDELQKTVLGEFCGCLRKGVMKNQAVAVSVKIANLLIG